MVEYINTLLQKIGMALMRRWPTAKYTIRRYMNYNARARAIFDNAEEQTSLT